MQGPAQCNKEVILGIILLISINFNPGMDKYTSSNVWDEVTYKFPNINVSTVYFVNG